ncbi:hypothetical protein [Clostridium botulinum]|nr:hypothetical protein [Clostridium botulinum]MBD5589601.1 hypothetical protein [Clostridium botulinum]HDI3121882.1 hypothetical protein [Clostridium botulinum]
MGLPAGPIALIVATYGVNAAYAYDRVVEADEMEVTMEHIYILFGEQE